MLTCLLMMRELCVMGPLGGLHLAHEGCRRAFLVQACAAAHRQLRCCFCAHSAARRALACAIATLVFLPQVMRGSPAAQACAAARRRQRCRCQACCAVRPLWTAAAGPGAPRWSARCRSGMAGACPYPVTSVPVVTIANVRPPHISLAELGEQNYTTCRWSMCSS